MRFHVISQIIRSPLLRRVRWSGTGFLDREAPRKTATLWLLGDGAAAVRPVLRDRRGAVVPSSWAEPAQPDPADAPLLRQPAEKRQLLEAAFDFPEAGSLMLEDGATGTLLAQFTPEVRSPLHIFGLLQETQLSGFAPGGYANFVETGTLFGHTTLHASYWFDRVTTIELSEALHAQAVRTTAHRPNVTCLHGNSGDRLPEVIAGLRGPTFFFLDAHWSGDNTVDWDNSTWRGYPVETARIDDPALSSSEQQVPLLSELRAIVEGHPDKALVLIDDWQTPGMKDANFAGEDWSHIDPEALIGWMAAHPRTHDHFPAGWNRYVWLVNAA